MNLKKIEKLAIKIDWDQSFGGKSRGNRHLSRVILIADFLAKSLKANKSIVRAGALLHDVALPTGNDYDYEENKKIVLRLLEQFAISVSDRNAIAECVASHEGTMKPKTLEAKIVHDADVLEKSGILGIIRHTWKMTNLFGLKSGIIGNKEAQKIIQHIRWRHKLLCTPLARTLHKHIHEEIKGKTLVKFVRRTAVLAEKGVITEKIAVQLAHTLTVSQRRKLKEQLTVSYLRSCA